MKFSVSPSEDKKRLDHVLSMRLPDVSRSFLQSLCKHSKVLVNGRAEKSGYRLRWGDVVAILHDMNQLGKPDSITMPIIYEDDDLIVVNKPAGVLSHALSKFKNEPSVASFLREHAQDLSPPADIRYGIVHRLDRLTSGVMVCAKHEMAMKQLQKQFAARTVKKTYLAVVASHPKHDTALIDVPLERHPKAPATFRVSSRGKSAQTDYRVLGRAASGSDDYVLEVRPKTGRTHQIRVHLQHIGFPIKGDVLYGGKAADRLYLHAYAMELEAVSGAMARHRFVADPPEGFKVKSDAEQT